MKQITEIKTSLSGEVRSFQCDVLERAPDRLVVLYRIPRTVHVHGVTLPEGSYTIAYFWPALPFNLYHWVEETGEPIAYYFNVGDVTRYEADVIGWNDLAVDVIATPAGRVDVLDEDELPPDMDPAARRYVESARDLILRDLPRLMAAAQEESRKFLGLLPQPAPRA